MDPVMTVPVTTICPNTSLKWPTSGMLDSLNIEEAKRRWGTLLYMGVLITIGIPGNILVLIVYLRKFSPSTHKTFILGLAWVDLIGCSISMPFEIIEMNFQYNFYAEDICRFFRFFNATILIAAGIIIIVLSFDRYRRVCLPLGNQMTNLIAKLVCTLAIFLSAGLSWPLLLFYGIKSVPLECYHPVADCNVKDTYQHSKEIFVYNTTMVIFTLACIISLIIMYVFIGRKVMWHKRFLKQHVTSPVSSTTAQVEVQSNENETEATFDLQQQNVGLTDNEETKNYHGNSIEPNNRRIVRGKSFRTDTKVTLITFLIALLFILSYLPYLIVMIVSKVTESDTIKPGPLNTIGTRSVYIHCIVNPVLFGFSDTAFRRAVRSLCKRKRKITINRKGQD